MRKQSYKFTKGGAPMRFDKDKNGDIWNEQAYGAMNMTRLDSEYACTSEKYKELEKLVEKTKLYDKLYEDNKIYNKLCSELLYDYNITTA